MNELLVLRAQAGDRDALEELIGHARVRLQRYVGAMIADAALAGDVLQKVLFHPVEGNRSGALSTRVARAPRRGLCLCSATPPPPAAGRQGAGQRARRHV